MSVPLSPDTEPSTQRESAALACRILAMEGLADGSLGQVSVRAGRDRMLIRCHGTGERGLLRTGSDAIRLTSFDGSLDPGEGYSVPNELALHGETLRTCPEVNAVVHVHPRAVLLCGIAGLPLRPTVGITAADAAFDGVPLYARSVPVRTRELAREMLDAMGDSPVCVLRGHGITVTGATLEQAVVRAVELNMLAEVALDAAAIGGAAGVVSPAGRDELPGGGAALDETAAWRALAAKAAHRGL